MSTRYTCAVAGLGRWNTTISSSASAAGSHVCITRFISGFPLSARSSALSLSFTPSFSSIAYSLSRLSFMHASITCLIGL